MREYKRVIAVLLCVCMAILCLVTGLKPAPDVTKETNEHDYNDSLIVWYTDDAMTDYLNAMAVEYHEKGGMRVLPRLHPSSEYVESIYGASIACEAAPDLYIVSNDTLEKAYLSGCAYPVDEEREYLNTDNFPKAALDAVSYKGHMAGYPYYFETSALLYNKTYLHDMISQKLKDEISSADSDPDTDAQSMEQDTVSDDSETSAEFEAQVEERMQEAIPETFDDLLAFADTYDAPEDVEGIIKWDVRDVFFNYFFIGNYIDIGGDCGDDISRIDVYNVDAIKAMNIFQHLNSYFAFESSDVTYAQVVDDFIAGRLVFATATSDIVNRLKEAEEAGEFEFDYGLAMIPDLSDSMLSRSLSVTEAVVVNGYSDKTDEAESFARFLTVDGADGLYDHTGKLPAYRNGIETSHEMYDKLKAFTDEYFYSVPMPKLMTTSNYWLLLEKTFADVWSGKDASAGLQELAEQLQLQIRGQNVTLNYIRIEDEEEEIEYYDEESLRIEAMDEEE